MKTWFAANESYWKATIRFCKLEKIEGGKKVLKKLGKDCLLEGRKRNLCNSQGLRRFVGLGLWRSKYDKNDNSRPRKYLGAWIFMHWSDWEFSTYTDVNMRQFHLSPTASNYRLSFSPEKQTLCMTSEYNFIIFWSLGFLKKLFCYSKFSFLSTDKTCGKGLLVGSFCYHPSILPPVLPLKPPPTNGTVWGRRDGGFPEQHKLLLTGTRSPFSWPLCLRAKLSVDEFLSIGPLLWVHPLQTWEMWLDH